MVTSQTLDLSIERAGTAIGMTSKETTEETPDGKPIAFPAHCRSFPAARRPSTARCTATRITREDDDRRRRRSSARSHGRRVRCCPKACVWPDLRKGLAPGTRYSALAFQPSSLDVGRDRDARRRCGIGRSAGRREDADGGRADDAARRRTGEEPALGRRRTDRAQADDAGHRRRSRAARLRSRVRDGAEPGHRHLRSHDDGVAARAEPRGARSRHALCARARATAASR